MLELLRRVRAERRPGHVGLPRTGHDGCVGGARFVSCFPVASPYGPALLLLAAGPATSPAPPRGAAGTAERRLLERYETLLSALPQTVWTLAPDGAVTLPMAATAPAPAGLWHPGAGARWMDSVHPKDRDRFGRVWREATRERSVVDTVVRVRLGDDPDRYRHLKLVAVPVPDGGTEPEWIGTVSDAEDDWRIRKREQLLAGMAAVPAARDLSEAFRMTAAAVVPDLVDAIAIFRVPQAAGYGSRAFDAPSVTRVAVAPGLPELPPLGEHFRLGPAADEAVNSQQTMLFAFPAGAPPGQLISDASTGWLREAGATCLALLPVVVDGRTVALASAANCRGNPPPDETDLALLQDVLRHMDGPLRRTLELQSVRDMALALQQSFLAPPPEVEEATLTALYHPADAAAEVGGDWYDAVSLPDGSVALTIGDIAGHDMAAATAMGRVNSMLRGLAYDGGPTASPAATLSRLDRVVQALDTPSLITAVHALLRPGPRDGRRLVLSNAGHPPPLLIPSDAPPRFLHDPARTDPPLCVADSVPRTDLHAVLRGGDILVLYTDGLVEVPGTDIDHSLQRLCERAEALSRRGLPLPDLIRSLLPAFPDRRDDIAVIALQTSPRTRNDA
ncbi:SpoIIE family protein phosphatase [Streptomyces sp. SID10815]|nr:SpoIIE family protein phosphatase [Streptomyces sp. SID10815]